MASTEDTSGGAFISNCINKPIARWIVRLIVRFPITPNHITFFGSIVGILSAYRYSQGDFVLGGILLYLNAIFDGVDGELARRKNLKSQFGGILSTVLDRVVDSLVMMAMILFNIGDLLFTFIALLAILGTFLHTFSTHLMGRVGLAHLASKSIARRDVRLFIIFVTSVLAVLRIEVLQAGLALVTALTFATLIHRMHLMRSTLNTTTPSSQV